MLPTHTVDVYRLTKTGNNQEYDPTAVITGLDSTIFPAQTDILAVYPELPAYATYEVFVYQPVTLENADKLKSGDDEYIIRGVPTVYDTSLAYYQRMVAEKVI